MKTFEQCCDEVAKKLEKELNPRYENDVFTWHQIKVAIMKKENETEKIQIIIDKKKYEIGKLFTLEQLKSLAGVNNECYGICLIIPILPKTIWLKGNPYGNAGNPDYELTTNEVHDAGHLLYMGMQEPLKFFSFIKTKFNV